MAQRETFRETKTFGIEESISLLRNSSFEVKIKLAESEKTNIQILKFLSEDLDSRIRYAIAYNQNATPSLLEKLSRDTDWTVRYAVARNPNTLPETIARLTTTLEHEERVRSVALQNPNLPFDIWLDAYDSYDKGVSSAARLNPKHAKRA